MNKTRMGKRAASLLLSLVMMLSLLPTAAYAAMADGVETQGAIVSENGTDVSDDSNSSGNTGGLQVGDSKDSDGTGDQQVEGSNGSGTADDTTGTEGGADPTDSVNGNDSADPQDDGDAVMPTAANVAKVGDTEYATLEAAIAALSSSSYTLELLDETAWDLATPVYWAAGSESGYAATLADALTAAYKANGDITIVCRPGTDVGKLTHGHVADDITIYGNNAYISSGECELEVDTFMYSRDTGKQVTTGGAYLEKDITVTAYELDNLGVWGQRHTDHKVTVNLTDCDSVNGITVQRVYISGTTGVNDITLTGCDFGTRATSVYSNADGAVVIDNCSFTGAQVPVNFNHKANGAQTVTVRNSTFTGCGDNGDWKQFAAPVRFVNSGSGKMDTTVGTCTFTDTVGGNGDILLGDGRVDQSSNDVKLNVANTEATVQAQQPGYYGDGGTTDESKQGTKNVAASDTLTTSVTQLMPSSELTNYVTVSGIKGFDGTKFATFADAYAAIKPVVATLGLGQETPADAAAFDAVFTDISTDGKATLTYTITGNVTYDETGLDHLLTMGRSSSHYLTNERHLINFKFVGAEADRGATLTVNSNITLPYEWWGEKITTSISFENLTITGSAPSGLFAYQSFFEGIDFKVNNCTLKGIKIYNCANVGGSYTITNSKLDGTGAAKDAYAIHLQGNDTAPLNILIENNQISGYDRGVNIDQATAIATISGNSISINDNDRSCIQLTQLAKTTVSGNSMTLTGGNAITLHGNLAAGSKIEVIGNNITGTGYLIYDAAKGTIDLTYTDNTVSDTIDTTKGVYGGKEYKVSENVANALKSDTTTYVAEVKGVKYDSLQAAVDAAKSGATVTLLADTRENVTVSKNAIVLDLNGHTLNGGTVAGQPALTVRSRVTVKDSSAAQTGTIMREDTAENSGVSSHYVIDIQDGWLFFESGSVTNNSGVVGVKGASLVRVGDDSVAKYPGLTISGGTFTQDNFIVIKVDRGTFYLKEDGTLNSKNSYAVENWKFAEIKGGTVNGTVAAWTYSGGHNSDLTISGGTVNGNVLSVNYGSAEGKVAKVSITGGTVNGALDTRSYDPSTNELTSIDDATKATIAVTGGTFSKDPSKYVVENSGVTPNGDGTFGVAKAYLAKVGDTSYYTMDEAFKAQTTSGETIVLLRDYTTGSAFSSGSIDRTVDLNGHTWTCTGTDANSAAFEINYSDVTLTVKNGKVVSSQLVGLIPSAMGGTIKYDNSGLVFEDVVMETSARSGIETNGNNTNDTVTLKNSTLNVPNGYGIYFPSSGTLTIDNSVINAQTMGVQVCAGSLNISGAKTAITVSGDGIPKTINDGAIEDGAAISIVNRTGYKGLSEITVKDGKFTAKGTNAAVKAYNWKDLTPSDFTQNDKVSVSGGTFSSAVDESLCADGFIPTQNADGTYGVKEGADGYVEDENGNVTISTAEGLFYFAKKANAGNNFAGKTVKLANDIDLNNEKWTPIGSFNDATTQFKGTFDGQNHAVTGLKVEESRKNGVGFFGKVYTGTIKNLTVEGSVSASGCNYVGGIVGHGYATITNCTFKGSVGSTDTMQVGGIAGSGGFTVTNCSVYADVTAECWAGGIVGNCQDGGAYTNCYVEGIISSKSTFWGGGAAGITPVPLYPSQVISGCYSNTVVKVAGEEVNCPIIACYNNPLDYNGYSGGLKIYDNSWNKQKNSNDSYPIYAEKDGKGGVLMEGMTAARDNSLIMLEDDLNYVTGDLSKVRIMAGSSVTQAQIDALAVASVGDSKYKPLAEAIDAAQDGQTVTLLADAAEDVVISKSITLDLGGKTLTNTNAGKATISVTSGTVTVKNGNVVGGNDYYNIEAKKDANLTLTDVTATAGNTGSSMIDNWGTLTITSGTYTGGLNVVKSEEDSKLTITGGTFELSYATNGYTGVIFAYGDTTISGGEFIQSLTTTGRWNHPTVVLTGVVEGHTAITRVTGGHFVNKMSGESIFRGVGKATSDNFKVSGGTFNKSIPDAYCADGFIPTKNADGTYGVKEGQYVAQINSKKYETLADAIRLATKGKTITLLADVEQNTQLTINKSITLDLNGKTIRNTVDIWGDKANAILSITNGAKVTITGNGTIDAKENDCYTINVVKGDLTIENGTFYGNVSVVQVEEGTLSVKGGTFDLHQKWEGSSKYLFNCIDKAYVDGSANVAISGGTFVGFDPNVSPEQKVDGKTPSFAAPGVGITRNENGSFTAVDGMTAQILDKDGNSVNAYNTLAEAVAAAQNGQTVRLLANVAESSIKVNANITIDLNKMTVTGSFVTYGEVTIQNGTIDVPDGETNYAYGKLTLADVDITGKAASSSLLSVNYNGSVTIDKDSTIVADSAKGDYPAVFIKGQDDSGKTYAPELNIYGTVQSAKTPAIQGNGTDRGVSHVNVFEGAVVKSESLAVYLPQPCEVNITGGLVEGYCGIGIKSGTLNISGGTVRGVANDNVIGDEYSQTNGISYDGSAIMIDSYIGYAGQVQINISGNAVVESKYSTAIREIGNDKSQTNLVGLDITGGTVLGAKDTDAVLVRDVTAKDVNISGGEFSSIVKKEYCAPGFTPVTTANSEGRYGVEIGKFTVKVTSRTTGSDSPVANVAGGGSDITYAQGTTVTASAISGYNFVGWFVNEYTGTPYSTDLTCKVKPTDDWTMIAVYEPISGGKFWLTVTASEFTVNGGAVQDSYLYEQFAGGASVTVNFTGSENFLYWVNASNKVVSTEKSYTFIMGSETTLKAVYGKARQNQATVVFISHSDQIISSKAYTTNDTIQFPVPPIKMGCTFTGWSMTEADIRAAMANNSGIIQVRALYTEPSIACKVTVVYPEGTDNQVVNAVVGKAIDVTAKDIEGKTFSYWTDNAGNILGYTKTLKLAPSGDMTVKAVYDQAAEAKPVITMSEVSATTANESYVVTFMATRAVPNGYKVVKQGILWSRDAVCGEDGAAAYMQFDSNGKLPDGVRAYIGNNLDLNGVTRYDITTKYNDRTFYGRGYMVLESDAGELLYIYTDTIASGSYDSLTK